MTVSSDISRFKFAPVTDTTGPFTFNNTLYDESHLIVVKTVGTTDSTLTLNVDYTVSIAGDNSSATVTTTANVDGTNGDTLTVYRDQPYTQESKYPAGSKFQAKTNERSLDRGVMIAQQQKTLIDRAPKASVTDDAIGDLPNAANRSSKVAGYDGSGDPAVASTTIAELDALAGASAIPDLVVDSVAAMKAASSLTVGKHVQTTGYYAAADGGGGYYRIVAGGTGTDDGGEYHDLANGNQAQLISNGPVNVRVWGATGGGTLDDYDSIQAAIDASAGRSVYIPAGTYLIGTGLSMSSEGLKIFGDGMEQTVLKAGLADMIVLDMNTARYQTVSDLCIDGDSTAFYGLKIDFPKCYAYRVMAKSCTLAGIWISYFSIKIEDCFVINNTGNGVLVKDGTGQVNDITIIGGSISGNAQNGVIMETTNRDGIWIERVNMEVNAQTAGFAHIAIASGIKGVVIRNCYHENDDYEAGGFFVLLADGLENVLIDGCKYSDGSITTPYDYFIRVASTGSGRNIAIRSCWFQGCGQKYIKNNLAVGDTNSLLIDNCDFDDTADIADSGQGLTITPNRAVLYAERSGSNQTVGAAIETVVFNSALGSTTQSVIDGKLEPMAYSITTGVITCFESGVYFVSATLKLTAPGVGVYCDVSLYVNTGSIALQAVRSPVGDGSRNITVTLSGFVNAAAGDTFEVKAEPSSGTLDVRLDGSYLNFSKIGRIGVQS